MTFNSDAFYVNTSVSVSYRRLWSLGTLRQSLPGTLRRWTDIKFLVILSIHEKYSEGVHGSQCYNTFLSLIY